MKKFDGMMPPTLVFADDGKNGDFGPPPSSCMEAGTTSGLTIRSLGLGFALRQSSAAAGRATSSTAATANACRNRAQPGPAAPAVRRRQSQIPRAITPRPAAATWAQSTGRWASTLPATAQPEPGGQGDHEEDGRRHDARPQVRPPGQQHAEGHGQDHPQHQVGQHVAHVEDRRRGERRDVRGVDQQHHEERRRPLRKTVPFHPIPFSSLPPGRGRTLSLRRQIIGR